MFSKRALYVERLNYKMDPSKIPENGHEYIHLVRSEHHSIFPNAENDFHNSIPAFNFCEKKQKKPSFADWKREQVEAFRYKNVKLNEDRDLLMKKFPRKQIPSVEDEKELTLFCLGSDMYKKIYDESVNYHEGYQPLLSIVLYFTQQEIVIILGHLGDWVEKIGMNHTLGKWIYGLLVCLQKPVPEEYEELLEDLYDMCKRNINKCQKEEKHSLCMIMAIVGDYFCVNLAKLSRYFDKLACLD